MSAFRRYTVDFMLDITGQHRSTRICRFSTRKKTVRMREKRIVTSKMEFLNNCPVGEDHGKHLREQTASHLPFRGGFQLAEQTDLC